MMDSAKEEKPVCTFFKKKVKQRQQRRRRESSDEEGSEVIFPANILALQSQIMFLLTNFSESFALELCLIRSKL